MQLKEFYSRRPGFRSPGTACGRTDCPGLRSVKNLGLRLIHHQNIIDAGNGPVNGLFFDHQRRRKANNMRVGLFGQDAFLLQGFTEAPRAASFRFEFYPDKQSFAAHLFDVLRRDLR